MTITVIKHKNMYFTRQKHAEIKSTLARKMQSIIVPANKLKKSRDQASIF